MWYISTDILHFWTTSQDFSQDKWYLDNNSGCDILLVFILPFDYNIKYKGRLLDSTQNRDWPIDLDIDYQVLPESQSPTREIIRSIRQQIYFQPNSHIDEIPTITAFTGNITHISHNIVTYIWTTKNPTRWTIRRVFERWILCQNFINQDLTFLQPSVIHAPQSKETQILPQRNTEISPIETLENNPPQEQDRNFQLVLPAEVLYDRSQSINTVAPIQPVEPVVGLTPKEQQKKIPT